MKAYVTQQGKTGGVQEITGRAPGAGEILVKNHAVTLNPTDWKHIAFISPPGVVVGCDFAGTVAQVGAGVQNVREGARVAGFVHGAKFADNGSFAEYVVTKAQNVMSIPDALSFEEAASVGIAGLTATQSLFQFLELKAPPADISQLPAIDKSSSPKLLVWAGSTAVGQYAVQLGRIAGYYVITTASSHNRELLESFGAQEVHDYKDPQTPAKIKQAHPDLHLALDCNSADGSQQLAVQSLGEGKGKLVVLLGPETEELAKLRKDVEIHQTL